MNDRSRNQCMGLCTDPIILGDGIVLPGNDVGITRPNDNVLVDGCSGVGKTTSTELPTMLMMSDMNLIASFAKEEEAERMAAYHRAKGYTIDILDLKNPRKSTVSFDPVLMFKSSEDIEEFSNSIVHAVMEKTNDSYWNTSSVRLSNGLADLAKKIKENAGTWEYLKLFDQTVPEESGIGFSTALHSKIQKVRSVKRVQLFL